MEIPDIFHQQMRREIDPGYPEARGVIHKAELSDGIKNCKVGYRPGLPCDHCVHVSSGRHRAGLRENAAPAAENRGRCRWSYSSKMSRPTMKCAIACREDPLTGTPHIHIR